MLVVRYCWSVYVGVMLALAQFATKCQAAVGQPAAVARIPELHVAVLKPLCASGVKGKQFDTVLQQF